ncbi:hypothetical protein ACLX1H_003543 [Fusarium chlamydosporum]
MSSYRSNMNHEMGLDPYPMLQSPTPIYDEEEQNVSVFGGLRDLGESPVRSNFTSTPRRPGDLELFVISQPLPEYEPSRWSLLVVDYTGKGTWYYPIGGPRDDRPWELVVEPISSFPTGVGHYYIATIREGKRDEIDTAAENQRGRSSQEWVVNLIRDLESQKIVTPAGKGDELWKLVEERVYPIQEISNHDLLSIIERENAMSSRGRVRAWIRGRLAWAERMRYRLDTGMHQVSMILDPDRRIRNGPLGDWVRSQIRWLRREYGGTVVDQDAIPPTA